ncbi:MAG: hypothetical protein KIT16_07420 [Rhodospirillaceae bacterium]|nr:hypothetical protein [Rhodospirillaceae bacterium]
MRVLLLALTCAFALVAAIFAPTRGGAEDAAGIKAFYGHFKGEGIAKNRDNLDFSRTMRDLDTIIEPDGDTGFSVKWSTVIRDGEGGRKIDNALRFVPSGKANVFKAVDAGDPIVKGYYAWARLENRILTVNVIEVGEDGQGRWQVYERRLTGDGMELTFRRLDPSGALRIVSGKLKRQK